VKNDGRVEQVVLSVREGVSMIRRKAADAAAADENLSSAAYEASTRAPGTVQRDSSVGNLEQFSNFDASSCVS